MTKSTKTGFLLLVFAAGLAGCTGANSPSPTAPSTLSQQPQPPPGFSYGSGYILHGVTLFGVISEMTPMGEMPVVGIPVYCDGSNSSSVPTAPSPVLPIAPTPAPQPRPVELAVFTDSMTGFSASDVHDVQAQIVRFNTADELIWVANDTRFQEFIVDGNFIAYHHKTEWFFQVRFGTKDGERRAYLTWPDDRLKGLVPTILHLWVG